MHTTFRGMRATLRARPTRVKAGDDTLARLGEVSEWSKERDWKSRTCCKVRRGFKSRPLRFSIVAAAETASRLRHSRAHSQVGQGWLLHRTRLTVTIDSTATPGLAACLNVTGTQ